MGARILIDLPRRKLLGEGLLLVMPILGSLRGRTLGLVSRRLLAQAAGAFGYKPLARPVFVPLANLATAGQVSQFIADGVTLPSAATPNQPVRIAGMVVRTAAGDNVPERFSAVCVKCPHEGCDVEFVSDSSKLPSEITDQIGHTYTEPVYVCPCHNSTFAIKDGATLAGPAPRGLYRFRITGVTPAAIEIGEVEEDVLLFV